MNNFANFNRITWIIIFSGGFAYLAFVEWATDQQHNIGWFLLTGLWSGFCGIGFSLFDWLIRFRN